jgi:hypothetical protein
MGMDFGESLKNHLRERNLTKKDLSLKAFGHIRGLEKYKSWTPKMYPEIYIAQEKLVSLILKSNQNV